MTGIGNAPAVVKASLGLLLLVVAAACGGTQPGAAEDDRERIEDLETGREVTFEEMIANLGRARVIYVGEAHDDPAHHRAQGAILEALHGRDPDIALGVEMVQRPFQPALDTWVQSAGAEDDEAALLTGVEWEERWGFDFELYRPLFELCRSEGIRIIALNARKELTRAVARRGLTGLSEELATELPELVLDDSQHRAMIEEALSEHPNMSEAFFERMYAAQVVWDETMADSVATALAAPDAPRRLMVIAGSFHVVGGLGVPGRAARRGATPYEIVLPFTPGRDQSHPSISRGPPGRYRWVGSRHPTTP